MRADSNRSAFGLNGQKISMFSASAIVKVLFLALISLANPSSSVAAVSTTGLIYNFQASDYNSSTGVWTNSGSLGGSETRSAETGPAFPSKGASPATVDFNGSTNGYQFITSQSYANPQEFTLNVWFRTSSAGKIIGFENRNITGRTNSNAYDRMLFVGNDGKLYFGIYSNGFKTLSTPSIVTDNLWRHVVATFASNTMTLYVNGSQVGTSLASGAAISYSGYWRIGGYKLNTWASASDSFFSGSLGQASIYTRALTSAEASTSYTDTKATYPPECSPTTQTASGYTTLTFTDATTACNWTVPAGVTTADVLIVGGGGGSGSGGGGAGGVLALAGTAVTGTVLIAVGAGGAASAVTTSRGDDGGTSFFGEISVGGGGGGGRSSGGPGSVAQGADAPIGVTKQGSGGGASSTVNQTTSKSSGFKKGGARNSSSANVGGGGGGAGGDGFDNSGPDAGKGGVGLTSSITGTSTYYAGGGGGVNGGSGGLGSDNAGGGGTGLVNGQNGVVIVKYVSTFTVTYSYNSATGGDSTASATFNPGGTPITLPNPSRVGFLFSNWYTAASGGSLVGTAGSGYSPTGTTTAITIHAQWIAKVAQSNITITSSSSTTNGGSIELTSTGGSTGGAYLYEVISGSCSIGGSTLTATAVGSCVIRSSLLEDDNYLAMQSEETTITISSNIVSATITLAEGSLTYRQKKLVNASAIVAGKVTFRVNGKVIPGCKKRAVIANVTITCSYRPSIRGFISISATLYPTNPLYIGTTTTTGPYFVGNRTGPRVAG